MTLIRPKLLTDVVGVLLTIEYIRALDLRTFFAYKANIKTGSKKYPIPRLKPQLCYISYPPTIVPGWYLSDVPTRVYNNIFKILVHWQPFKGK